MTGSGTIGDPYIIMTRADLEAVDHHLAAYYELGADIDLAGSDWTPIGVHADPFAGSFDGKGYKVSNMVIHISDRLIKDVGLFGYAAGATLKDIHVPGASVLLDDAAATTLYSYVGSLVGCIMGSVTDCTGDLTVTCVANVGIYGSALKQVGGLCGSVNPTIVHCSGKLTIANTRMYLSAIGGLVGLADCAATTDSAGTLALVTVAFDGEVGLYIGGCVGSAWAHSGSCTFSGCSGAITLTDGSYVSDVGGFAGRMYNDTAGTVTSATDCRSCGTINCDGPEHGGFVGVMSARCSCVRCSSSTDLVATGGSSHGGFAGIATGVLTDCYAIGDVNGAGCNYVGGLVGTASASALTNCYSVGLVAGNSSVGGLVGYGDTYPTATHCFWDTQTSGQATSALGTGKTTAQMQTQSTFTGWNFTTVWNIASGVYPFLRTAFVTVVDGCVSVVVAAFTHSLVWPFKFCLTHKKV